MGYLHGSPTGRRSVQGRDHPVRQLALGPHISAGFKHDGKPDFLNCGELFCGKAGKWAFDILNVEGAAQVPEPASLALVGVAALGIAAARRRKKAAVTRPFLLRPGARWLRQDLTLAV